MNRQSKIFLLAGLTLSAILVCCLLPPVAQNNNYHFFADNRVFARLPNTLDVLSNIGFFTAGLYGLVRLKRLKEHQAIKNIYGLLFVGLILTCIGSGYYHLAPRNTTLVYDRIPMTIVFMSLTAATIAKKINKNAGVLLVFPLVLLGIGSVLYWQQTEAAGRGDLWLYGFVQYYPMLLIPLMYALFPGTKNTGGLKSFLPVILWYIAAKLFEIYDSPIYTTTGVVSGHTLKHLAAAVATFYIVALVEKESAESNQNLYQSSST